MMVAQGYQESGLDQSLRNPSGAVGIMQVIPKYAAASPINIPNVEIAEENIHAGAKMMRNMADTYFTDQQLDPLNKTLMPFASYNAGPNRIAELRKRTAREGLNPNNGSAMSNSLWHEKSGNKQFSTSAIFINITSPIN